MRHRALLFVTCLSFAAGCGEGADFRIFVEFPDNASLEQTQTLRIYAVEYTGGAGCEALVRGTARPDDEGYSVDKMVEINPHKDAAADSRLDDVGPGRRLFYAEAEDAEGVIILVGCEDVQAGGGGVQEVLIVLSPVERECVTNEDCDDEAYCTGDERCENGRCVTASRDCNDDDICTQDLCNEELDRCENPWVTEAPGEEGPVGNSTCQDGLDNDCDKLTDLDDPECKPCTSDGDCDDQNECTTDSCVESQCENANLPAGTPCQDDGAYCNGAEECNGHGFCVSGGNPCPQAACNHCQEENDSCYDPPGTSCDDAQYCNGEDTCDGLGACNHSGDPCLDIECNHCQESADSCYDPIGTPCSDDGQYCTGFEGCDGAGHCVSAGNPCDPETECNHCNEDDRNCRDPAGTPCDDTLYCNGANICDGTGTCERAGNPCVPETECNHCNEDADNCHDSTGTPCGDGSDTSCTNPDTCDGGGSCRRNDEPEGTACNDDLYCQVNEVCISGACLGSDRDCSHLDEICHAGVCNEGTDACEQVAASDGTACADDLFCTEDEHCQGGACVGGSLPDCSDDNDCTNDVCNEDLNRCDHIWQPRPDIVDVCGDYVDNDCDGVVDGCCLGDGSFTAKVDYSAGSYPYDITTGDFDADGILDLAIVNHGSDNVSILLGNGSGGRGNGTFTAKVDYPTGDAPRSVATGDFNSDGILDLAVTNNNSADVSILLGNGSDGRGNGTFTAKVDYPTGDTPFYIASGDFNTDGILDLAVTNGGSDSVSILLGHGSGGKGDGTFTAKVDYPTGLFPYSVTAGDFNSDGILDLAVGNFDSNSVSILLGHGSGGKGDGTFTAKIDYPIGDGSRSITTGDFNSDGILDLAASNGASDSVSILLGNGSGGRGNGTFTAKVDYPTGDAPRSVATGDFNSDGILDLAVMNSGSNNLSIFMGNGSGGKGNGTFTAKVDYPTGSGPLGVVTGDFNADGIIDLAVTNSVSENLSVLLGGGSGGQANGTFEDRQDYSAGNGPASVTSGDFNSDGILDLAVMNYDSDNISILLGNGSDGRGDGTFASQVNYPAGNGPASVTSGDFNSDKILDLAVANFNSPSVSILLGNGSGGQGNGTFAGNGDYPAGEAPEGVTSGDFNSDGILDLAAVGYYFSNNLSILSGDGSGGRGDGTFTATVNYVIGNSPMSVTSGDFNSDGILDLAVGNFDSNNLSIFLGNGSDGQANGTFAARVNYTTGSGPRSVAAGDFNSDGILDLAVANQYSSNVSILLGHGNGTFAARVNYTTGSGPRSVASGDFNLDGILDLAVANGGSNNLSILLGHGSDGQGDGTFTAKVDYPTGNDPTSVTTGDFNSDGILDLAVVNDSSGNVSILLGKGECLAPPG